MADLRCKDFNWTVDAPYHYGHARLAVLMDIRDELKKLNSVFECVNFLKIPKMLRDIRRYVNPQNGKGRRKHG
ncbi:MAG: hypothetical protein WC822_01615 [Candidatus Paceibacterota bacterium]